MQLTITKLFNGTIYRLKMYKTTSRSIREQHVFKKHPCDKITVIEVTNVIGYYWRLCTGVRIV